MHKIPRTHRAFLQEFAVRPGIPFSTLALPDGQG